MVWKNQKSLEIGLDGFGVKGIQKCKKFSAEFFLFLSCCHGFMNCFEILNFVFSNIIPRGVSPYKILTFQGQYFQKYKAQNIVKFIFLAFLAVFFFNFALKTYDTLKMLLLSTQNNFYNILSKFMCRRACAKNSILIFMSLVGFQASKIWMLFWKIYCEASLEIIFRQK